MLGMKAASDVGNHAVGMWSSEGKGTIDTDPK